MQARLRKTKGPSLRSQKGQGLIEYLVIVALIGVAAIGVMRVVGQNLTIKFTNVSRAIAGDGDELEGKKVSKEHYSKKDLSNFMSGANSKDKD